MNRYTEFTPINLSEAGRLLSSGDDEQVVNAMMRVTLFHPHPDAVELLLATCLQACRVPIVVPAATCVGHLARIHGSISSELIELLMGVDIPEAQGAIQNALDDIDIFARRQTER